MVNTAKLCEMCRKGLHLHNACTKSRRSVCSNVLDQFSHLCRAHGRRILCYVHYEAEKRTNFLLCAPFLILDRTHTQTHPFNGPFSGTTQVSQYQKGKTNLDFTEARDSEWQWHQLGHMQVCTSLQTDNHASTPPLSFYWPDALPATQPTASKH